MPVKIRDFTKKESDSMDDVQDGCKYDFKTKMNIFFKSIILLLCLNT